MLSKRRAWNIGCVVFLATVLGVFDGGRLFAMAPGDVLEEAPETGPPVPKKVDSAEADWTAGARKMLEASGVGRKHFDAFENGKPFQGNKIDGMLKVMYWVDRFAVLDVGEWTEQSFAIGQFAKDPKAYQGEFFRLEGRVQLVETVKLSARLVELFGWKNFYRCRVLVGKDKQPVVIVTRVVPKKWKIGTKIDERVGVNGLFVKLGEAGVPIFMAQRVEWYPQTLLGNLGMNVGLLDDMKDRKTITKYERECFYQMLAAVGRAKPGQLRADAQKDLKPGQDSFSIVRLFNEPEKERGHLVMLAGTARRVVRVRVDDPDIVTRFGIDHYFEIFMFTRDSQDNPIVFCVRDLPKGMPIGIDVRYAEHIEVPGFFMKMWSYQSIAFAAERRSGDSKEVRRQLAPLLIGREPLWRPREEPISSSSTTNMVAGVLFVLVLLGIWIGIWISNRRDKQFFDKTIEEVTGDVDLNSLNLDVDGKPDFSDIERMDTERKDDV